MAQRHHSLDLSEMGDVTDMLLGFEEHNHCRIAFRFGLVHSGKTPTVAIDGEAWTEFLGEPGAQLSASVNVKCSDLNLRTWNAALIHVLYALDFQLALNEFEGAGTKKA